MRCSICDSGKVTEVERTGRILYQCSNGHERPTVVSDRKDLEVLKFNGKKICVKVASLIFTGDEIVMVKRKKFPFLYSLPFTHLEKDQDAQEAAKDALYNQTGLELDSPHRFKETVIQNRCWKGCNSHKWVFFKQEVEKKMLKRGEYADEARWFDRKEIIQGLPVCDGTRYLYDKGYLNGLTVI